MSDYFKFRVTFVMNITDVDDKIILAARQQHLLAEWLRKHTAVDEEVRSTADKAFTAYTEKNLPKLHEDVEADESIKHRIERQYGHVLKGESLAKDGTPPGDKEAKVKMHIKTVQSAMSTGVVKNAAHSLHNPPSLEEFALQASGILLPYIDLLHGSSVKGNDHDIFTKLTKRYEQRFFDDMGALNVRTPDKITRVTEYGPQIVDFVKRIQDNGFAYEHEGSVYYDTNAWEASGGHYARLEPWNRNDKDLQADGEGSLSVKQTGFKRSSADFALWKASKPGEPSWPSPWGEGRPGWHIECSAMASDVLGKQFDVHSGGIDLAFPHHDNELAQSEAYWCDHGKGGKHGEQWVNYFLHMGHLSIAGSKMSKSLKNFTTVREALAKGDWTPRSLRIVFLLGNWRDGLEITTEVVKATDAWAEKISNFFIRVRDLQRHPSKLYLNGAAANGTPNGNATDDLLEQFEEAKSKFHDALCDSFDTPAALRVLSDLVTAYNSQKQVLDELSTAIARWITDMVVMFGLDADHKADQIGWSGIDIPEQAKPFVYPLADLRDRVREQAIAGTVNVDALGKMDDKDTYYPADTQPYANAYADFQRKVLDLNAKQASPKDFLAACDYLRDTTLWNLSIYLEDREGAPALVRPLSSSLQEERQAKETQAAGKAAAKAKAKEDAEAAERERLEKGKLNPLEMFRTSEYSEWDAEGLPTKDAEGKEVAKSKSKKLRKDWERQRKLHEGWVASRKGEEGGAAATG